MGVVKENNKGCILSARKPTPSDTPMNIHASYLFHNFSPVENTPNTLTLYPTVTMMTSELAANETPA